MSKMNTVLITGANRGIGLEFTRQYAQADWQVYATCRTPEFAYDLKQLIVTTSKNIQVLPCDVTNAKQIAALKESMHGQSLDILINNAGVLGPKEQSFGQIDVGAWDYTMRVNTFAPLKILEALTENLVAGKRRLVVNLTSRMGSIADNNSGNYYLYRSSKAALNAVTRSAALDLAPQGIIVVALHPGWVKTDMGGDDAEIDVNQSVTQMLQVINQLTHQDSGKFLDLTGTELPW